MSVIKFNLEFNGYWLETNRDTIPNEQGIYCVYACVYYPDRNTVGLNDLLYIGESNDVGRSIKSHESKQDWVDYLVENQLGQTLCYSFAKLDEIDSDANRKIVATSLIFEHKPPLNYEKTSDLKPETSVYINTHGMNSHLKNSFTIKIK